MKLTVTLTSLLVATAGPVLAGDVVVRSPVPSPELKVVYNAFDACASAFVERMFPGQKIKFRTELNADKTKAAAVGSRDYLVYTVSMQAQLKRDDSTLAESSCTVSRYGRVLNRPLKISPSNSA